MSDDHTMSIEEATAYLNCSTYATGSRMALAIEAVCEQNKALTAQVEAAEQAIKTTANSISLINKQERQIALLRGAASQLIADTKETRKQYGTMPFVVARGIDRLKAALAETASDGKVSSG